LIQTVLEIPSKKTGTIWKWIDVQHPVEDDFRSLIEGYGLHETSVRDCLDPQHFPKYEYFENYTFMILRFHAVEDTIGSGDSVQELTNKIAVFLTKDSLITVHRRAAKTVESLSQRWKLSSHLQDLQSDPSWMAFRILCDLTHEAIRSYEAPVHMASDMVEEYEVTIFKKTGEDSEVLSGLYQLKRRAKVYTRMLHLLKNLLLRLDNPTDPQAKRKAPYLHDLQETCERLLFLSDELLDAANLLLNYYLSLSSHSTNENVRILTILSVLIMIPNLIVGFFGMNFHTMPFLEKESGPWIVAALSGLFLIFAWAYWRKRWKRRSSKVYKNPLAREFQKRFL
jgi:magnesium transporter